MADVYGQSKNLSSLPSRVFVIPVEFEPQGILELKDWNTPDAKGLILALSKESLINHETRTHHLQRIHDLRDSQARALYASQVVRDLGYDFVQYKTDQEVTGLKALSHIDIGPKDQGRICYCNMIPCRPSGPPLTLDISELHGAILTLFENSLS
ncbi:hypothetical protein [Microvirga arsenatis]|uniref:RES domain-containing protein n=1 Tax=Microvirga arsenatis TaxID=2692265 RepID=A0ABW9Z941_9HYPH|nr:hypothetical protein [Microvirga arsenatis]NBJ13696.1 hypothetical protein [Microvirga arsenatis]NBJ27154.1 hypothetical protein [Microvirga arsenatis]